MHRDVTFSFGVIPTNTIIALVNFIIFIISKENSFNHIYRNAKVKFVTKIAIFVAPSLTDAAARAEAYCSL